MSQNNISQNSKLALFIIALIFTSICMRGPIAAVGSLIESMEPDLGVSKGALGFITTLPLIIFAVSSLLIPKIANSVGHTRILVIGMFILAIGSFTRTLAGYVVVLLGTLLVGVGISIANVLISGIIKENMPAKIGLGTAIYLCFQSISATSSAAFSFPLIGFFDSGWRGVLCVWTLLAIIASLTWAIYGLYNKKNNENRLDDIRDNKEEKKKVRPIWKSKLAWYITIVMGTQSINYYCLTAWLPSILGSSGMDFETAGYVASMFQLFAIPSNFIAPIIIAHTKNKSLPAVLSGVFYIVGIVVVMSSNSIPIIIIGLIFLASGGGASFAWVVAIIAIVSEDSHQATRLSGMAQSVGYIMAAIAPTLAGTLFDMTGSWLPVLILVILMAILIMIFSTQTGKMLRTEIARI